MITRKAVADNLDSAAQIVMGKRSSAAVIWNAPVRVEQGLKCEIPGIPPNECMYWERYGAGRIRTLEGLMTS